MKIKKEYIALAVVIVGLVIYILFKKTDRTHYQLPAMTIIDKADISKVVIARTDGEITLQRQDDRWLIEPQRFPADQGQVDRMLDVVADVVLTSLVSESQGYTHYDLSDEKKIGIEVFAGDQSIRKLDIGKTASTNRHTFVQLGENKKVYQALNNLRQPFETDIQKLRDKNVSVFDKELVTAMSIKDGAGTFEINKPQIPPASMTGTGSDSLIEAPAPLWRTSDGRAADVGAVDGILSSLSNLRCDSFIEGKTKTDFAAPIFSITIDGAKPVTLDIFAQQADKKYPAVSSQNDYPFLLPEWMAKRIMKTPGEMVEETPAAE